VICVDATGARWAPTSRYRRDGQPKRGPGPVSWKMPGTGLDAFSDHESAHLTMHAHFGAGLGRVWARPGDTPERIVGSARPADESCPVERIIRLVAGQVGEGLTFAERDCSESDLKEAARIVREEVAKDKSLTEEQIRVRINQRLQAAWEKAAEILEQRKTFHVAAAKKIRDELEPRMPLEGKIALVKFGELWERVTGEVLPADKKPYG
jgi:hypothetical protein